MRPYLKNKLKEKMVGDMAQVGENFQAQGHEYQKKKSENGTILCHIDHFLKNKT
jgi:hypothetical protein